MYKIVIISSISCLWLCNIIWEVWWLSTYSPHQRGIWLHLTEIEENMSPVFFLFLCSLLNSIKNVFWVTQDPDTEAIWQKRFLNILIFRQYCLICQSTPITTFVQSYMWQIKLLLITLWIVNVWFYTLVLLSDIKIGMLIASLLIMGHFFFCESSWLVPGPTLFADSSSSLFDPVLV